MGHHKKQPVSLRLSEAEMKLLDAMGERHGGKSAAIIAGLKLLSGQTDISIEDAIARLAREHGLEPPKRKKKPAS